MRTQRFRTEYRVVIRKHNAALVIEMVGVAIAMPSVSSTQWDPVRNTGFSLINAT